MAPALIKSKGPSEAAKSGVSLFSSKSRLHTFLAGGQVWDKRKQYNLYNPASHLRNIMFRKVQSLVFYQRGFQTILVRTLGT